MDMPVKYAKDKVIKDVLIISIMGILIFYISQIMTPFRRGFFCNDESIKLPFHESTVPSWLLHVVALSLPIFTIIFMECLRSKRYKEETLLFRFFNFNVYEHYWISYNGITGFLFGGCCSQILTELGKKVIGRLRPNFFDVCRPNVTCLYSSKLEYMENYKCMAKDESGIEDARLSFPSGHSSFSFYVAVFLIMYIQARYQNDKGTLLKPLCQFIILLAAWFTALSRVMNNKHHWSDVLAGICLGTLVAIVNTTFVMKLFDQKTPFGNTITTTEKSQNSQQQEIPEIREQICEYYMSDDSSYSSYSSHTGEQISPFYFRKLE